MLQHEISALYQIGMGQIKKQKYTEAEITFNNLLNSNQNDPFFLHALATCCYLTDKVGLAVILFKRCLSLDDKFEEAYVNYGKLLFRNGDVLAGREILQKCLNKIPGSAGALFNLSATYLSCGTPKKAYEFSTKALVAYKKIKFDIESKDDGRTFDEEQIFDVENNIGMSLLEQGKYKEGFKHNESRGDSRGRLPRNYDGIPVWDGTPGQTVIVYGEQGIGDEIMFASCIPDLMKECTVIIDAHPRLMNMFRDSFPGVLVFGTRKSTVLGWVKAYKADACIAIASLCHKYRNSDSDFPRRHYITPNRELKNKYSSLMSKDKPNIGISWKGGTKDTNQAHRLTKLEQWLPILSQDINIFSLQYHDDAEEDINQFNIKHDIKIHHDRDMIDDYYKTCAFVSNLDLVISVPQSIVHLTGAMGVPTWQLTPFKAMWQMGVNGKDLPWYANTKSFWQHNDCKWEPVFNKVGGELCKLLAKAIEG